MVNGKEKTARMKWRAVFLESNDSSRWERRKSGDFRVRFSLHPSSFIF